LSVTVGVRRGISLGNSALFRACGKQTGSPFFLSLGIDLETGIVFEGLFFALHPLLSFSSGKAPQHFLFGLPALDQTPFLQHLVQDASDGVASGVDILAQLGGRNPKKKRILGI